MQTDFVRQLMAFGVIAALVVGACGPDEDESGDVPSATAVEEPAATLAPDDVPEPEPTDPEPTDTDPTDPDPTDNEPTDTEPADSEPADSGSVDPASADWCGVLDETDEVEIVFAGLPTFSPAEVEAGLLRVGEILPLVTNAAPPEIAADVAIIVGQAELTIDAFEAAGWSFLDVDLSVFADADEAEIDTATFAIDDYSFANCGRTFGDPSPDPSDDASGDDQFDPAAGTFREQAVAGLVEAGFTAEEADCLVENIDLTDPAALSDPEVLTTLLEECGIGLDRLAQLGG